VAWIAGVNFSVSKLENKRVVVSLTYIRGSGLSTARKICKFCNIDESARARNLSEEAFSAVRSYIRDNDLQVEGDLKKQVAMNIKFHKDVRSYRGLRHLMGLPARGQRTHTNAKTNRRGKSRRPVIGKKGK